MDDLTKRQREIFELIKHYIDDTGYPPTRVEIAEEFGFRSPNASEDHLRALERKGYIEMVPGASRGIRIPEHFTGIPIVGDVAAGEPILAEQNIDRYIDINSSLFTPSADYLLNVHGDSMVEIGINDGDLLAVHKTSEASNGQVVVARIDDDVTVKRYQKKRNKVFLHPENSEYDVIEVDLKTQAFSIEGLGVGVIRDSL